MFPEERKDKSIHQSQQSLEDCTVFRSLGTDAALMAGWTSRTKTSCVQGATVAAKPTSQSKEKDKASLVFDKDRIPRASPSELRDSKQGDYFSPFSRFESPTKIRSFWKTLASLKTLGSFDSDSMVKESNGRRAPPAPQPFIDRYVTDEDDPILSLRSPVIEVSDVHHLRADQANKAYHRPRDAEQSVSTTDWHNTDTKPRKRAMSSDVMPRQSNARYLSNAPVPQGPVPLVEDDERRLRQSTIWMTSIPEQKVPVSEKPSELPKPVEESVMYLMGPLMSGDSEEEEVSVVTDDFTAQDDNASVVAQQSCYTCGGLAFRGWGWL